MSHERAAAQPEGDVIDWYRRGLALLSSGDSAAAAALLAHAVAAEPDSRALRETLARALYDAKDHVGAAEHFGWIVAQSPTDDYAHFGLGLSLRKLGRLDEAAEHLALAVAMAPENRHYGTALNSVRVARGTS